MVSVELADELPGVIDAGENEAVAPGGSPLAARFTALVNAPFCGVTEMEYIAEPPGCMVCAVVDELTVKLGGATAVKLAVTLSGALMVIVVVALLAPPTLPVQLVKL
jgi:hypothetical protein